MLNHWPELSRPLEGAKLVVLSHGAGVQTSTMCLMAARGDITPMPDVAYFADTGNEPARVYRYLEWLRTQCPFPIETLRRPGPTLAELAIGVANGTIPRKGASMPPLYTRDATGRPGMLPKQCSKEYKTRVVSRKVAERLGIEPGKRGPKVPTVEMWIGISRDEIQRAGTNERKWIHNRHPLIELNMTRQDCIRYLQERQYEVAPKSSCVFCPFRDQPAWARMAEEAPEDFETACDIDDAIRAGWPGMEGTAYIHRDMVPLREVDLRTEPRQSSLPLGADCDSCGW